MEAVNKVLNENEGFSVYINPISERLAWKLWSYYGNQAS